MDIVLFVDYPSLAFNLLCPKMVTMSKYHYPKLCDSHVTILKTIQALKSSDYF